MNKFIPTLTVILAALSVLAGIFISEWLAVLSFKVPDTSSLKWTLIIGMPVALWVSYIYINLQSAIGITGIVLQCLAQIAVFSVPFWWLLSHVR